MSRWIVCCLLAACTAPSDSTIDITHDACAPLALAASNASELQLAGIADGIALWRERGVTGLDVAMFDASVPAAVIPVEFERAPAAFHGLYDDEVGTIYLNDQLADRRQLAIVLAHELGHAFGLPHVAASERTSLMNPGNLSTPPTDADQAALEALWGRCN